MRPEIGTDRVSVISELGTKTKVAGRMRLQINLKKTFHEACSVHSPQVNTFICFYLLLAGPTKLICFVAAVHFCCPAQPSPPPLPARYLMRFWNLHQQCNSGPVCYCCIALDCPAQLFASVVAIQTKHFISQAGDRMLHSQSKLQGTLENMPEQQDREKQCKVKWDEPSREHIIAPGGSEHGRSPRLRQHTAVAEYFALGGTTLLAGTATCHSPNFLHRTVQCNTTQLTGLSGTNLYENVICSECRPGRARHRS